MPSKYDGVLKSSQPSPLSRISLNDQSFIYICLLFRDFVYLPSKFDKWSGSTFDSFCFCLVTCCRCCKGVGAIHLYYAGEVLLPSWNLQGIGTFAFVPCSNQRQDRADYGNLLYKMVAIGWLWISCYTFILHGISEFKKIVSVFSPSISK